MRRDSPTRGHQPHEHAVVEEIGALRRGFLRFLHRGDDPPLHACMHEGIAEGVQALQQKEA
jgi:hypothetical protein